MSKLKTHVITVSRYFLKSHPKAGRTTGFVNAILNGTKIHTIRHNYDLWKERIDEVNAGKAILSVRYWTGKPYQSKQQEFIRFDKNSGIDVQKLEDPNNFVWATIEDRMYDWKDIAKNDGLSLIDFGDWFKGVGSEPMAIIHFTEFRYNDGRELNPEILED